ncbi:unnamed protein product [Rotaria sp. Silwood2]|nr:unnamed protein product [Rotaria sp. Silwood2]CAF2528943.1 unnamed protein product [Rotaria sp. Silwood2]CAF2762186.1 unnamed protein product [Rotaria sp. Silwood2]CAF2939810.1 unnamed protein product [Rotaria sp. Silwood2]CAF3903263.1 unnamed protein product [Rotaria sp. Silwood2]
MTIASFHLAFANPLSQLFGTIDNEAPPFDIVSKGAKYAIRRYHLQLWAQVDCSVDPSTDFGDKLSTEFQPLFNTLQAKTNGHKKFQ